MSRLRWLALSFALLAAAMARPPAAAEPYPIAVIRVLDKITARVRTIAAPIGEPVTFATLRIVVQACDRRPPEEPPLSAAFLEISEGGRDGAQTPVFSGWMFSASPSLSAMEHPIYDVWVLSCESTADSAAAATASGKEE